MSSKADVTFVWTETPDDSCGGSDVGLPPTQVPNREHRVIEDWPALLRRCAELDITARHLHIEEESLETALASIIAVNSSPAWKLAQRNKLKKQLQRAVYDAETAPPPSAEGGGSSGSGGASSTLELPTELLVSAVLDAHNDPHASLGLEPSASVEVARKRYHGLLLRLHPDKCGHAQAKQATQAVEEAYRTLCGAG